MTHNADCDRGPVEHDHTGPDWRCEACKPLADVLRKRMSWASVHWGGLHDDAYPSLAKAIHGSEWLAEQLAEAWDKGAAKARQYRDGLDLTPLNPYRPDDKTSVTPPADPAGGEGN